MSNPNSQGNVDPPKLAKDYEKMIKLQLKYLPKQLQAEYENRAMWDPRLTEQAMGFQEKYDPRLAQEQLDALRRRDPQWLDIHEGLGDRIKLALEQGYLDPRQEAAYERYSQLAGRGEPTRDKAYEALGQNVIGEQLRGETISPTELRQRTQALMAKQPALSYGEAQDMVQSASLGMYGHQLQQQRQQATGQFLQTATPTSQREQSFANFYGQAPPEQNVLGLAGTYIQPSNTVAQALSGIPGVQAPRAFGYVNPNAGLQGAQYGLQNFQNQLAAQQGGGGGGNPWTQALQGASTGASYGSMTGNPYIAAGGAIIGAGAGAFGYPQYSDERLKKNISRTRLSTPDGIEIVEYDYNGKRWRGVIAQDVEKVRPDAVHHYGNGTLGVFYSRLGIELQEVN